MAEIIKDNDKEESTNPLLDINTSFADYLRARTRNSTEHIIDGKPDYAFDGDYALKAKVSSVSGWSKYQKSVNSFEIPNEYKRSFRTSDAASSMLYPRAYRAVNKSSERLQVSVPAVLVKAAKDIPEIYSLKGDGFEPCIIVTSDIIDICTEKELCYLFGCEIGKLRNNHCVFRYTCDLIRNGAKIPDDISDVLKNASGILNKWIISSDFTADRAGIICLDNPADFAEVYISLRRKCIPDSYGNTDTNISLDDMKEKFDTEHKTPVRNIRLSESTTADERRILAGLEFTTCEVLYSWRPDLDSRNIHLSSKQSLEIRCETLAHGGQK